MTKLIGLTGGIGVGKSTVTQTLMELGVPVFDCDKFVAEAYRNPTVIKCLEGRFGDMGKDAKATMAELAWNDQSHETINYLSAFFGGIVVTGIIPFINHVTYIDRPGCGFAVIDAPTLCEAKMEKIVDKVVLITAPLTHRWDRVKNRSAMTQGKFQEAISQQMLDTDAISKADFRIENDYGLDELYAKVLDMVKWCQSS